MKYLLLVLLFFGCAAQKPRSSHMIKYYFNEKYYDSFKEAMEACEKTGAKWDYRNDMWGCW